MDHQDFELIPAKSMDILSLFGHKSIYIPCKAIEGKKAAILQNWSQKALKPEELPPNSEMIALRLDDYVAIDCDGESALNYFIESFDPGQIKTFYISSIEARGCYIFKKPENWEYKLFTVQINEELLEIRSGSGCYQVIQGIHPETKDYYWTNNLPPIELNSEVLQWISQLKRLKAFPEKIKKSYETIYLDKKNLPEDFKVNLLDFVSNENAKNYKKGVKTFRNNSAFNLACDLLGCEEIFDNADIPIQTPPEQLFQEFCDKCPQTDFTATEIIQTWSSAKSQHREPSISAQTFNYKWQTLRNQLGLDIKKPVEEKPQEIKTTSNQKNIMIRLYQIIKDFDTSQLQEFFDLDVIVKELAIKNELYEFEFIQYLKKELHIKIQKESELIFLGTGLQNVNSFKIKSFSKTRFYEDFQLHKSLNAYPFEFLFINLLTAVSSLIPHNHRLFWNSSGSVNSNIFTILIGSVASGKSRLMEDFLDTWSERTLIDNNAFHDNYKKWEDNYKKFKKKSVAAQIEYFEEQGDDVPTGDTTPEDKWLEINPEPQEILPLSIRDSTLEGIRDNCSKFDKTDRGLLWAVDELSTALSTLRVHSKQNNDPLSSLLPIYNGDVTNHSRVSDQGKRFGYYNVSLLTTTQSTRLLKFFDISDPSGILSRFLFMHLKEDIETPLCHSMSITRAPKLKELLSEYIDSFQLKIHANNQDEAYYHLSKEAFYIFSQLYDRINAVATEMRQHEVAPGISQWLKRLPTHFAKLIFVWHLIKYAEGIEPNKNIVSSETVSEIVPVILWLKNQTESVLKQVIQLSLNNLKPDVQEATLAFRDLLYKSNNVITMDSFRKSGLPKKLCFREIYIPRSTQRATLNAAEIQEVFRDMERYGLGHHNKEKKIFTGI
jgi:hypothetical protein